MSEVAGLVAAMRAAWDHRWESLSSALRGVEGPEAEWQADCYAAEEREDGWPPPGSIRWQVAHVTHCKRYYARLLASRGKPEKPVPAPREAPGDFAGELATLDAAHREQLAEAGRVTDAELDLRLPNGMTVREFLAHQARHDVWHASQIAVARRLYRTSSGRPGGR